MNKRRLFIAINLPESVKRRLVDWQKNISIRLRQDSGEINWVRKNNLHITLVFIGYVSDDETYEICNVIKDVAKRHNSFYINLERIITGPPHTTPRMFWVEGEKSQELANLQGDLENVLLGENLTKKELRAYRPHATLARFKYQIVKLLSEKIDEPFKYQVPVESIEVMQSNLKRSGAEYTILESVNLGNGA